jgi:hypothetical protein
MANTTLAAVMTEPANNEQEPSPARRWNVSDTALMDEIDEIIIRRLADAEAEGVTRAQLRHRAEYYGRMYDLVYAKLAGPVAGPVAEPAEFIEQTYEFLAEGFWQRIEAVYDPNLAVAEQRAKHIINKTRAKLKRLEIALFKGM